MCQRDFSSGPGDYQIAAVSERRAGTSTPLFSSSEITSPPT
jgi:hypothetical protein